MQVVRVREDGTIAYYDRFMADNSHRRCFTAQGTNESSRSVLETAYSDPNAIGMKLITVHGTPMLRKPKA